MNEYVDAIIAIDNEAIRRMLKHQHTGSNGYNYALPSNRELNTIAAQALATATSSLRFRFQSLYMNTVDKLLSHLQIWPMSCKCLSLSMAMSNSIDSLAKQALWDPFCQLNSMDVQHHSHRYFAVAGLYRDFQNVHPSQVMHEQCATLQALLPSDTQVQLGQCVPTSADSTSPKRICMITTSTSSVNVLQRMRRDVHMHPQFKSMQNKYQHMQQQQGLDPSMFSEAEAYIERVIQDTRYAAKIQ